MTKLLILTAGYGEGHNAAARNLAAACETVAGPGSSFVVDLFALAQPKLNRAIRRAYLAAINGAPGLWNALYVWIDRHRVFPRHLWLLRSELRALTSLLARERPTVVCSTYPLYAFLLERLADTGGLAGGPIGTSLRTPAESDIRTGLSTAQSVTDAGVTIDETNAAQTNPKQYVNSLNQFYHTPTQYSEPRRIEFGMNLEF